MLTLHLRDAGVRVISAGNCRDTFAILKTGAFDVALVDYQLPDGNGLEVVSLLRQAFPRVRLIMMSGSEEPLVSHHRLGMQVCDFLKKPFSYGQLDALVQWSELKTSVQDQPPVSHRQN